MTAKQRWVWAAQTTKVHTAFEGIPSGFTSITFIHNRRPDSETGAPIYQSLKVKLMNSAGVTDEDMADAGASGITRYTAFTGALEIPRGLDFTALPGTGMSNGNLSTFSIVTDWHATRLIEDTMDDAWTPEEQRGPAQRAGQWLPEPCFWGQALGHRSGGFLLRDRASAASSAALCPKGNSLRRSGDQRISRFVSCLWMISSHSSGCPGMDPETGL